MNSSATQAWSSTTSLAGAPSTVAWVMSGYWVAEWLPQMIIRRSWSTGTAVLLASWASARLWSRRVIAVNRSCGTSGALLMAIRALVLAGLPTTSTRMSSAAWSLIALPWGAKIPPLASSRSPRSMPLVRGRAPTSSPMLAPSKAMFGSSLMSIRDRSGKAQSVSSMAVPSAASSAGVTSSRLSSTGRSGPSSWPEAIRKRSA